MLDRLPQGESRLESVLIPTDDLATRVRELAEAISRDFAGHDVVHLVGVLKGAWVFLADLARAIRRANGPPVHYHFLRASTYGAGLKAAGETERAVHVEGVPAAVRGADVVLVEDILDQGFTLAGIRRVLLTESGARSVRLCVLLNKTLVAPSSAVARVRAELVPDYVGFEVPDRWVAGYGLDVAEEFRDLPFIAVVREACFRR